MVMQSYAKPMRTPEELAKWHRVFLWRPTRINGRWVWREYRWKRTLYDIPDYGMPQLAMHYWMTDREFMRYRLKHG